MIPVAIFIEIDTLILNAEMQVTWNSQTKVYKEQNWKTYITRCQDSVVLTKKWIDLSVEQNSFQK